MPETEPPRRNVPLLLAQGSTCSLAGQLASTSIVLPFLGAALGGSLVVAADAVSVSKSASLVVLAPPDGLLQLSAFSPLTIGPSSAVLAAARRWCPSCTAPCGRSASSWCSMSSRWWARRGCPGARRLTGIPGLPSPARRVVTTMDTAPSPRLVALDIDGTTIDHAGVLSPHVAQAVTDVVAAGHHVVIATGRSIVATMPVLAELGLTSGYAVCSNGAVTLAIDPEAPEGYRVVETVTFDPRPVLTMLRAEIPEALVAVEDVGVGFKVSALFPEGELGADQVVVPWEELVSTPVTRVTLRRPDVSSEEFMEQVERVGLHEVAYAVGWTAWLDINPEGVSKGSALELVRRRLHVEPDHTVAVGDMRNDLEMLRWAARGVAMGQAPDDVQAAADEVTGTVEDDGLATVLRSLL